MKFNYGAVKVSFLNLKGDSCLTKAPYFTSKKNVFKVLIPAGNTVVTLFHCLVLDLGRMYNLVSRITDGLGELKKLLETHIHNQGLAAIEKCGEAALNVQTTVPPLKPVLSII